jgi:hypothetical protein
VVSIVAREEGVVNGAVVPIIWMPPWQNAVSVMTVDVGSLTLATLVPHP